MEVLKKLAQCGSVSGEEQAISALISEELSEFEQYTDALGNLIVHKKGTGKTILFAAQMDEMDSERVILVVPKPYIQTYPKDRQDRIWTVGKFVQFVRETERL